MLNDDISRTLIRLISVHLRTWVIIVFLFSQVCVILAEMDKDSEISDCTLATQLCSEGDYVGSPLGLLKSSPSQPQLTTRTPRRSSQTVRNRTELSQGQVCGTDGRTYISECQLLRARCEGHPVGVKHKGVCKGEEKRCWDERRLALKAAANRISAGASAASTGQTFIPECTDDGKFAEIQCHRGTGYCFCVAKDGKPIPGSSTKDKKPNCLNKGKSVTNRRSPTNKQKTRKGCSPIDKTVFNSNLIKIFTTEYNRSPRSSASEKGSRSSEMEVIDWKFRQIDQDADNVLIKTEFKTLRRHVKKLVRPRRCAKNFPRVCDSDDDKNISLTEWSICLGLEMNSSGKSGNQLHRRPATSRVGSVSGRTLLKQGGQPHEDEDEDDDSIDEDSWGSPSATLQEASHSAEADQNESNDCYTDRQSALEEVRQGAQGMYVPECTHDGKYQKVQCHKGTSYCWCANELDGKPIPNTSVHNKKPNCNNLATIVQSEAKSTPKPRLNDAGCPNKTPKRVQEEMIEFYRENMASASAKVDRSSTAASSANKEAVARWQFAQLDASKNLVIDRNEMKEFRLLFKKSKKLKKCKRLATLCDPDDDKKITLIEWRVCLGLSKGESMTASPGQGNRNSTHMRRGKNPLSTYLKD